MVGMTIYIYVYHTYSSSEFSSGSENMSQHRLGDTDLKHTRQGRWASWRVHGIQPLYSRCKCIECVRTRGERKRGGWMVGLGGYGMNRFLAYSFGALAPIQGEPTIPQQSEPHLVRKHGRQKSVSPYHTRYDISYYRSIWISRKKTGYIRVCTSYIYCKHSIAVYTCA